MEKKTKIILLIFLIIGVYLRISGTLRGYFGFSYDQAKDALALHKIVYEKDLGLIGPATGIDGVFHGVWWYWFLAPIFFLVQGNPMYLTAVYGLFKSTSIIIAYYLGKQIQDNRLGIILAGIVSAAPFFVSADTQIWNPNTAPYLTILWLYFITKFLNKSGAYFWIAVLLAAIIELGLGYGLFLLPAFVIASIIFQVIPNKKEIWPSAIGFIFIFLPRILFELRHNFRQTHAFIRHLTQFPSSQIESDFLTRIGNRGMTLFQSVRDAYMAGNSLALIFFMLIVISGAWLLFQSNNQPLKKLTAYLIVMMSLIFIISCIYPADVWSYYLIGIPVLLLPVVGMALSQIISTYSGYGLVTVGVILAMNFILPWKYFGPMTWEGDASVYKNQIAVVDYIYSQAQGNTFNIAVYAPSLIDYNYQYLFLMAKKIYGYQPDRQKVLPLVFFIIEPDPWNKGLRQKWIAERTGDGQVLKQQELTGGIVVEKRLRDHIQ